MVLASTFLSPSGLVRPGGRSAPVASASSTPLGMHTRVVWLKDGGGEPPLTTWRRTRSTIRAARSSPACHARYVKPSGPAAVFGARRQYRKMSCVVGSVPRSSIALRPNTRKIAPCKARSTSFCAKTSCQCRVNLRCMVSASVGSLRRDSRVVLGSSGPGGGAGLGSGPTFVPSAVCGGVASASCSRVGALSR